MAATSTKRSRPVAQQRAKAATAKAKSATRKATTKAARRAKGATTKAKSETRQATKKVAGRAKAATGSSAGRHSDVIALIKADHVAVNQLFKRYGSLGPSAFKTRRQVAERVIKELSVHAAVEEQILYPKVQTAVPNGDLPVVHKRDETVLVANELAANAVLHGEPPIHVQITAEADVARVEVHDEHPEMRVPTEESRGLVLIDRIVRAWGVSYVSGDGKVVWAEIPLAPSDESRRLD